jgi:hypothetical protein
MSLFEERYEVVIQVKNMIYYSLLPDVKVKDIPFVLIEINVMLQLLRE